MSRQRSYNCRDLLHECRQLNGGIHADDVSVVQMSVGRLSIVVLCIMVDSQSGRDLISNFVADE
jgi:hypothetical protein